MLFCTAFFALFAQSMIASSNSSGSSASAVAANVPVTGGPSVEITSCSCLIAPSSCRRSSRTEDRAGMMLMLAGELAVRLSSSSPGPHDTTHHGRNHQHKCMEGTSTASADVAMPNNIYEMQQRRSVANSSIRQVKRCWAAEVAVGGEHTSTD